MQDLAALWLDRDAQTERGESLSRPGSSGDDDGVGLEGLTIKLDCWRRPPGSSVEDRRSLNRTSAESRRRPVEGSTE